MEPHRPTTTTNNLITGTTSSRHGQVVAAAGTSSTTSAASAVSGVPPPTSFSKGQGFSRHKKPTLDEVVESVFHSVSGDYGDAKGFDVPANFYDFYDNPLFRHFLACIVYYYFGFVDVRKLEERLLVLRQDEGQPPPIALNGKTMDTTGKNGVGASSTATNNAHGQHNTDVNTRELSFSQLELRRRLRLVGEAYSRLLLNCSNFEHTSEDKHFFEFIFEFTRSVTRLAIDKKYWDEMEQSLSYLFRGYMFNNPALRSKASSVHMNNNNNNTINREDDDKNDSNGGSNTGSSTSNSTTAAATTLNGGSSNTNGTTKMGNEPIDLARRTLAKYRSRVTGAPRARGIRALRRMRKKRLHEATSTDFATGLLPPEISSVFGMGRTSGSSRRSMSSVREIINARSPLVSMLLPTPVEASANAQMMKRARSTSKKTTRPKVENKPASKNRAAGVTSTSKAERKSGQVRGSAVVPKLGRRDKVQPHRKRGAALFDA
jgi:hypothetical protein